MDKFSPLLKLVLGLALVAILVGGSFYVGKNMVPPAKEAASIVATPSPTQYVTTTLAVTNAPVSVTPTTSPQTKKTVIAGLPKSSGLSFSPYTLVVPDGWVVEHKTDAAVPTDTLTLTKNNYVLKMYQAATGGAMCLYPGDPAFQGPSSSFTTFIELTTQDALLMRRSGSGGASFTVCQSGPENTFQQPTSYGHISFSNPLTPDDTILKEMDEMVKSLKKIQ